MLSLHTYIFLASTAPFISAFPSFLDRRQAGGIVGVATFNDYANQQGGEVCKNAGIATTADNQGVYKAAAGDISPDLSKGLCDGSQMDPNAQYDLSKCTADGGVVSGYPHPSCNNAVACGTCYGVANFGVYPTDSGAQIGKSVVVQIVDACPAGSALNYCKVKANPPIPADERCGAGNTLDIDYSAYKDLTGTDYQSSNKANLKIHITPNVPCKAGAGVSAGVGSAGANGSETGATGGSGGGKTGGTAGTSGTGIGGTGTGGSSWIAGNPGNKGSNTEGATLTQSGTTQSQQGAGNNITYAYPNSNPSTNTNNPGSSYQAQQQSSNANPTTDTGGAGKTNGRTQSQGNPNLGNVGKGTGGGAASNGMSWPPGAFQGGPPALPGASQSGGIPGGLPGGQGQGQGRGGMSGLFQLLGLGGMI